MEIPLYRADLTLGDERVLLSQLARAPFKDNSQLLAWERSWEEIWERGAVAFASHREAIGLLKKIMGWRSGDVVEWDPWLDPVWREALEGEWLHLAKREEGALRAVMRQHRFGLPTPWLKTETLVLGHDHGGHSWGGAT
ncbi:MAG: hypothetical protein HQL93_06095 [Magnetococcales bacterium]|nr:hypothetical protein [Magnetococcales bacterium]